jgi:hypothetical protein
MNAFENINTFTWSVVPQVNNFCTLLAESAKSPKEFSSKNDEKDQEGNVYPDPR